VIPEEGQVPEYAVESSASEGGHVLHEDEAGLKYAKGIGDGEPESTTSVLSHPGVTAGVADVLAGEARGDDVHARDAVPVHGGQVAEVRDNRVALVEDLADVGIVVCAPGWPGTADVHDGHVQAAVASAQRADPRAKEGTHRALPWDWLVPVLTSHRTRAV
jgi:hypothetical protein